MRKRSAGTTLHLLWGGFLASSVLLVSGVAAESGHPESSTTGSRTHANAGLTASAQKYYRLLWGVDMLELKPVSSGAMIRFSYRVVDANKAKQLNDKEATPQLIDPKSRVSLVVPTMEKIGKLRQTSTPEIGREYWMLFSNKGNLVQPGSRVDVVIGRFHAEGLIVQSD
jgi:hypothetical protein